MSRQIRTGRAYGADVSYSDDEYEDLRYTAPDHIDRVKSEFYEVLSSAIVLAASMSIVSVWTEVFKEYSGTLYPNSPVKKAMAVTILVSLCFVGLRELASSQLKPQRFTFAL